MKIAIVVLILALTVLVVIGCASTDALFMKPEKNAAGETLYEAIDSEQLPEGSPTEVSQSELDAMSPEMRNLYQIKFSDTAKDGNDFALEGVAIGGVSVAGIFGIIASIYALIRRATKKKQAAQAKAA
jgi:hypothetical protein